MEIIDQTTWIEAARNSLPEIASYAQAMQCPFDLESASARLKAESDKSLKELHGQFERLWQMLPDSPEIRWSAFSILCDLCSESWVLYETEGMEP